MIWWLIAGNILTLLVGAVFGMLVGAAWHRVYMIERLVDVIPSPFLTLRERRKAVVEWLDRERGWQRAQKGQRK